MHFFCCCVSCSGMYWQIALEKSLRMDVPDVSVSFIGSNVSKVLFISDHDGFVIFVSGLGNRIMAVLPISRQYFRWINWSYE